MSSTRLQVLGVYKFEPPEQAYHDALEVHGDPDFVRSELSSLVLVELKVEGADYRFELGNFKQPHTVYVPYDETFLDPDTGEKIAPDHGYLGFSVYEDPDTGRLMKYVRDTEETKEATIEDAERYRLPGRRDFVVLFFLHFYDPAQPLSTPYGLVALPAAADLPVRLRWKRYVYWD
ncbi:MAG: hypothetical protein HZC36_14110 [Armatimonadetes bacterium]|nr:hypothetical protein [Armatimonadota bacterium]